MFKKILLILVTLVFGATFVSAVFANCSEAIKVCCQSCCCNK